MILNSNRTNLQSYNEAEIPTDSGYFCSEAGGITLYETAKYDFNMFEAVANILMESELADIDIITEATISDAFNKIKEFVKKVWEKIKSLFQSFIAKWNGVFLKDNKELHKKYEKTIMRKDLTKMKYKWQTSKDFDYSKSIDGVYSYVWNTIVNNITNEKYSDSTMEKVNDGSLLDDLLSKYIGVNTDYKSFNKDLHDVMFEDEETDENPTKLKTIIGGLLTSSKDTISKIEKLKSSIDKQFKQTLKDIDKISKESGDKIQINTGRNYEDDVNKYEVNINKKEKQELFNLADNINKAIIVHQNATNKYISGVLSETKKYVARARGLWVKMATYNPLKLNESTILENAVYESEYEASLSYFDEYVG